MLSWGPDPWGLGEDRPDFDWPGASSRRRRRSGDRVAGGLARSGQVCALCGHDRQGDAGSQTAGEAEPGAGPVNSIFTIGPRRAAPPVTSWPAGPGPYPVPPLSEDIPRPAGFDSRPISSPAIPWPDLDRPLSFATPVDPWSGDIVPGSPTWLGQVCPLCGHNAGGEAGDGTGSQDGNDAGGEA